MIHVPQIGLISAILNYISDQNPGVTTITDKDFAVIVKSANQIKETMESKNGKEDAHV